MALPKNHIHAGLSSCTGLLLLALSLAACRPPATTTTETQVVPKTKSWKNGIGMEFLPIPGLDVKMSVYETRVMEFATFVDDTGYDASENFYYYDKSWKRGEQYWRDPGFPQTSNHPVVGISWRDAVQFCNWLTEADRRRGLINDRQAYRLPTDEEWTKAAGTAEVAPQYNRFANYHPTLELDSHEVTSPVTFFPPNEFGFYDMAGNAWEYCLDKKPYSEEFRIIRGGSWQNWHPRFVGVQARGHCGMDIRIAIYGFRVVLAPDDERTAAMRADAATLPPDSD